MMFNYKITFLGIFISSILFIFCLTGVLLVNATGWILAKGTSGTTVAGQTTSVSDTPAMNQIGIGAMPRSTPTKIPQPVAIQPRSVFIPTPLPQPKPITTTTLLVTPAAQAMITTTNTPEVSGSDASDVSFIPTVTPTPVVPVPTQTPVPSITPVTVQPNMASRLVIPKLNLDIAVLPSLVENQTWRVDHLGQAVGHLEGTAAPGTDGNMVLAGHVTLAAGVPGPFINLNQLATGDLIIVYKGDKVFQYVVDTHQVVNRTSVEVVYPTEMGQVTLITCTTWSSDQGRYQNRLVVTGRLVKN
jgi:LPXTG-site transpeptidase (sortase) family protein